MLTTFVIIISLVVLFSAISDKVSHPMSDAEADALISATQSAYATNHKDMK